MRRNPKEKPPADWRGDVIVLAHELGHLLDSLKLADAKWLNGKAPYYGLGNKDVYGANVLLENLVRKELDEYSKRMGDNAGVLPRPSYGGVPYDKDTRIAGEEYDRLSNFLAQLKKQLPPVQRRTHQAGPVPAQPIAHGRRGRQQISESNQ